MESAFDKGYECALEDIIVHVEKDYFTSIEKEQLLEKLQSILREHFKLRVKKSVKTSDTVDINSTERQHIYINSPHTVIINKDDKGIEIRVHSSDGHGSGGVG